MSLRPLGCQFNLYAQLFRRHTILKPLRYPSCSRDTHFKLQWAARTLHLHEPPALSQRRSFVDLPRSAHTTHSHSNKPRAHKCHHESTENEDIYCAHCGGKTIPKIRKPVDPTDHSLGWHCKPCRQVLNVHGALPNEEQLVLIRRRRLIWESGETKKRSPCRHCGEITAPKSSRKFIDPENPSAGFHCRSCVRHVHQHGSLPSELEIAAFRTRRENRAKSDAGRTKDTAQESAGSSKEETRASRSKSTEPKQSRDPHNCQHCGDLTYSNNKRRLVEPQNPSSGYYCQPCSRSLIKTDALPSTAQIEALRKRRLKRSATAAPPARAMKSPCVHCGMTTAPGGKRRLVDPQKPSSGYYCRGCSSSLKVTNSLPDAKTIAFWKSREKVRQSNIQAALEASASQAQSSQEGSSPTGDQLKSCEHCKADENTVTIRHLATVDRDICTSCLNYFDVSGSLPDPNALSRRHNLRIARARIQADIEAGRPLACGHCKQPRPQFPTGHWKIGGQFFDLVCPRCQRFGH